MPLGHLFAGALPDRSASARQRDASGQPLHPLPRDLADAPDWLLDDVGQSRGTRPDATVRHFLPWVFLVRRLG